MGYVTAINQSLKVAPTVEITVDAPWSTSSKIWCPSECLRDPLFDLVVICISGARKLSDSVCGRITSAATLQELKLVRILLQSR